ncbi:von Willebrand domain-containing protein [Thecamonas trahens ATCC 50062]|uniref:von Willebrand domain-containing protein n=1 Tax=Thecamonas trahens ATCC 50062 TaxID=461836 RepID=A0A0L0DHI2_THETB|nr:von Willebrand domain-containing protein [Thecamonas trahens ATCC 50062]KNC51829.1 von Willebrand domain-containing protein [Thecamonas trahens ATCC 50062]|eukprot:XP_013755694.1 von Willebrand domain-containing protein [Thecamonas trahens ATCC 50062]
MIVPAGLYYTDPSTNRRTALPLTAASVAATIADGCARVALTQSFTNVTEATLSTKYMLPMDEGAAVISFEANCNGRIIKARVEESGAAKAEYDSAVARGDGAYLLDSVSSEHFVIAIGNVQPGAEVAITTTYVANLRTRGDVYSFVVPNRLAPKYGASLAPQAKHLDAAIPLDLVVQWTMSPGLAEMDSPSHPDVVDSVVVSDDGTGASLTVRLATLDVDFVLNAVAVTPPGPVLLVENRSLPSGVTTQAAMVSFTPQLEAPDERAELVFVIDRSGSMGGSKIEHARKALQLFLRSLPEDCYFNIVGFGSRTDFCFPRGRAVPYNDETLEVATAHIAGMGADLGGTELLSPLRTIFATPAMKGFNRQVFVLTDGQVSNTNEVIRAIATALDAASAPTRVFTLGLGNGASRALVNGMARAGNGTAYFIDDDASSVLTATVVRQLKQALQPQLAGLTLEWTSTDGTVAKTNVAADGASSSASSGGLAGIASSAVATATSTVRKVLRVASRSKAPAPAAASSESNSVPPSAVVQAPYRAPPIFNGDRFVAFAFFKPSFGSLARLRLYDASGKVDFAVALETLPTIEGETVHALAARALIRDLEEGSSYMHATGANTAAIDAEIVRLGTAFSLASTKTSFVAVEIRSDVEREEVIGHAGSHVPPPPPPAARIPSSMRFKSAKRKKGRAGGAMRRSRMAAPAPARRGPAPPPAQRSLARSAGAPPMAEKAFAASAMSAPVARAENELFFDADVIDDCEVKADFASDLSEDEDDELCAHSSSSASGSIAASAPVVNYEALALDLAMLQSTKGMFKATALAHLPAGKTAKPDTVTASDDVWTTALVLAFFATPPFRAYDDQIELVVAKARKWLTAELADTTAVDAIIAAATTVLAA